MERYKEKELWHIRFRFMFVQFGLSAFYMYLSGTCVRNIIKLRPTTFYMPQEIIKNKIPSYLLILKMSTKKTPEAGNQFSLDLFKHKNE